MSKSKKTGVLVSFLLLLFLALDFFYERKNEKNKSNEKKLFSLSETREIQIKKKDFSPLVLKQVKSNWIIDETTEINFDSEKIISFLKNLENFEIQDFLDSSVLETPKEVSHLSVEASPLNEKYGFLDPEGSVDFISFNNQVRKFLFSNKTNFEGNIYAQDVGNKFIFTISPYWLQALNKSVLDFENLKVLNSSLTGVESIFIKNEFHSWKFLHKNGIWSETEISNLDQNKFRSLMKSLISLEKINNYEKLKLECRKGKSIFQMRITFKEKKEDWSLNVFRANRKEYICGNFTKDSIQSLVKGGSMKNISKSDHLQRQKNVIGAAESQKHSRESQEVKYIYMNIKSMEAFIFLKAKDLIVEGNGE